MLPKGVYHLFHIPPPSIYILMEYYVFIMQPEFFINVEWMKGQNKIRNSHSIGGWRTFNLKSHTLEVAAKSASATFEFHQHQRLC